MAANSHMTVAAILVAGGSGTRLGHGIPKAFVEVGGRTLLEHAAGTFVAHSGIRDVVVVAPVTHLAQAAERTGLPVVAGGATRQESVRAGLGAIAADAAFVLVHDVARPFVPESVIDAVIAALRAGADAVIPVLPVIDTVRRIGPDGALAGVVDRSDLVRVQTPQGFRRAVLVEAHERGSGVAATDDAALVEALGVDVVAVPGHDDAFKITTVLDYLLAQALAQLPEATPLASEGEPR
jgi:2-C-methyl-D-erythritol 4-phosphate cytidylyltransferase